MPLLPKGTTVTVETKYFPPLTVDLSSSTTTEKPNILLRVLKPRVTVAIQGQVIARVQVAGNPDPNQWPKAKIVLAVAAAMAAFTVLRIIRF